VLFHQGAMMKTRSLPAVLLFVVILAIPGVADAAPAAGGEGGACIKKIQLYGIEWACGKDRDGAAG
jgi:hypothetical protein